MPLAATSVVSIPDVDIWTYVFDLKGAEYASNRVIYTESASGRTWTFSKVKRLAKQIGTAFLQEQGWQKGDVLAICSPTDVHLIPLIFGCLWLGAVVTLADPACTPEELAWQLYDSNAKAVITHSTCLDVAERATRLSGMPHAQVVHLSDFTNDEATDLPVERPSGFRPKEDVAILAYSSGMTGHFKGVKLTHFNIVANMVQADISGAFSNRSGSEKIIGVIPFSHVYGLFGLVLSPICQGLEVVLMSSFELGPFCTAVQQYKVTTAFLVPPMILRLTRDPEVKNYDLLSLQNVFSAAAPLPLSLAEQFYNTFHVKIKQIYGMTETGPVILYQASQEDNMLMGSAGRLLPSMTAKIVSTSTLEELLTGREGELWIKGPSIFVGYHRNADATADSFGPDGYFKTGDLGYFDNQGNFFITGRKEQIVKYNGYQFQSGNHFISFI
ncbi:hypothetical protein SLS56_008455 [Neofusicoccum ribis]|uniref:AMP-dependent synthetase/ligase domain-containing protein n=1 Tax=Neofusicoccum ribis TaxID=45134 RepID=A0ABR3SK43_9PEZI